MTWRSAQAHGSLHWAHRSRAQTACRSVMVHASRRQFELIRVRCCGRYAAADVADCAPQHVPGISSGQAASQADGSDQTQGTHARTIESQGKVQIEYRNICPLNYTEYTLETLFDWSLGCRYVLRRSAQ